MPGEPAPIRPDELRFLMLTDEREPLVEDALALIEASFTMDERQPLDEIRMAIEEMRRGLLSQHEFHLLVAVDTDRNVVAVTCGVYMEGVNAGFVDYLAVRPEARGTGTGSRLRTALVEAFREDARRWGEEELAWVLGEVEKTNPWLRRITESGDAIPFDFSYIQPRLSADRRPVPLVLYREPIGDRRESLPTESVCQLLYAIYRRVYRIGFPLRLDGFRAMLAEIGASAVSRPAAPES